MKNYQLKSISLLFVLAAAMMATGCKKDKKTTPAYTCATCKTTPDAKAANNSIAKGVYKGLIVGSSGVINIDVQNSGATAAATIVLDGQTVDLVSDSVVEPGQGFTGTFTGTGNGHTYSFSFSVAANGQEPDVSELNIPGHPNAQFLVIKETSDNLIKCYEGTSTGTKDNGSAQGSVLNFVISEKTGTWFALSKDNNSSEINASYGTVVNGAMTCECGPTTSVKGTITVDEINGTYKGEDNHGTFTAKRTL